jgi:hypothetical protein
MLRIVILLVGFVGLGACAATGLDPVDRARVDDVQRTYDSEFRAAIASQGLNVRVDSFSRTLEMIQRDQNPNSQIASYYDLLEGLIYLQTGQLGLAQAAAPEITASARQLDADGIAPRNVVLAENYADLVDARIETDKLRSLDRNSAEQHTQRVAIVSDIEARTARVTNRLCGLGTVDDGAAFVAAYQATSLLEADNAMARACVPDVTDAEACGRFLEIRPQLNEARNMLAAFAGDVTETSQIAQTRRKIEQDLRHRAGGGPVPPPTDPC